MALTPEQQLELVLKFEPILWLHHGEAFIPVDVSTPLHFSDLFKGETFQGPAPASWNDMPLGKEHSLRLRHLDSFNLRDPAISQGLNGPTQLALAARKHYGSKLTDAIQRPLGAPGSLRYYARVSDYAAQWLSGQELRFKDMNNRMGIRGKTYQLIEYFFYYVYNDHWNQHQGDWDSAVHVFLEGGAPQFILFHFHHASWVTSTVELSGGQELSDWIREWQGHAPEMRRLAPAALWKGHPFVFITRGAHGAYPTPGVTLNGLNLPGGDFLASQDEREIGKGCIHPKTVPQQELRGLLERSGVDAVAFEAVAWPAPELVAHQPWRKYRGRWGAPSQYRGFEGPQDPPISKEPPRLVLEEALRRALASGYSGGVAGSPDHSIGGGGYNYHGTATRP
jgi:hypothetical protein